MCSMSFDERYWRAYIGGICANIGVSEWLRDDAIQDAVIHVWQLHHTHPDKPKLFYVRAARNHVLQMMRYERMRRHEGEEALEGVSYDGGLDDADHRLQVEQVGSRIDGHKQDLFVMLSQGFTEREIAESVGLTRRQVNDVVTRARKKVRAFAI